MLLGRKIMIGILAAGMVTSAATVTIFALNDKGIINLHQDELREYNAQFYSEGALVYETGKIKKGTPINYGYKDFPTKRRTPDGKVYQCIGWDITGEGLPDVVPTKIYGDFKANAVFIRLPAIEKLLMDPDLIAKLAELLQKLNVELTPEQVQKIMDWLMNLGIDWESIDMSVLEQLFNLLNIDLQQFLDMMGIDLEGLMAILARPMFKYTATKEGPYYFRNQSFGNTFKDNSWTKSDYYATSNISSGSVNPLAYSTDKIFGSGLISSVNFNMTYVNKGDVYPVPCNELNNTQNLNSESYSLTSPTEIDPIEDYKYSATYSTSALGFVPACTYAATILKMLSFSNDAIAKDELAYREYARSHYLEVDDKYRTLFSGIANENGITKDDTYNYLSQVLKYFSNFKFNYMMKSYPSNEDKILYFINEAKEGIGTHFADAATMFFRTLGVPARTVSGYVDIAEAAMEERTVTGIQAHNWTEVYLDGIGWMTFDACLGDDVIPPEYSQYLTNSFSTISPDMGSDKYTSLKIEPKGSTEYFIGESTFSPDDFKYIVTTETGEEKEISASELTYLSTPDLTKEGKQTITAFIVQPPNVIQATIEIEVIEIKPVSLKLNDWTYETVCFEGEDFEFNPTGVVNLTNDSTKPDAYYGGLVFDPIDTSEVGTKEVVVSLNGYPEVKQKVEIDVTRPVSMEINRDNFRSTYLQYEGDVSFEGVDVATVYCENGRTRNIKKGMLSYEKPNFNILGEHDVTFKVKNWEHITSLKDTATINVIPEPVTDLKAIGSLSELEITPSADLRKALGKALGLEPEPVPEGSPPYRVANSYVYATYKDNTRRAVDTTTGAFSFKVLGKYNLFGLIDEGEYDISKIGSYLVSMTYTERGVSATFDFKLIVRDRSAVYLDFPNYSKDYDGQEIYINSDEFRYQSDKASEGQRIQLVDIIYPEDYDGTSAGDYSIVYQFKIYNENDVDITEEYGKNSDIKMYVGGTSYKKGSQFAYDPDSKTFYILETYTIAQREITLFSNSISGVYSDSDLASAYKNIYLLESTLADGDYIDTSSIIWTGHVKEGGQSENTIDLSSLRIRSHYRQDEYGNDLDVTSNYAIEFDPGTITYGGGA